MLRLLIGLALVMASATAEVRWRPSGCVYPQKVYRGKPFYFQCGQGYSNAFPVTNINIASFRVTAPGHNFVVGDRIQFISSNLEVDSTVYEVLPDIYNPVVDMSVHDIDGDDLLLDWGPSNVNSIVEFGTKLGSAYDAGELMIGEGTGGQVVGDGSSRIFGVSMPAGFSFLGTWQIGGNSAKIPISNVGGTYTTGDGSTTFNAYVMVAESTALGPASITFTGGANGSCCTGQTKAYSLDVEVMDTKSLVPWLFNRPAPVAWPDTLLSDWEAMTIDQLDDWCNPVTGAISSTVIYTGGASSTQFAFYDAMNTYDQAFLMFGSPGYAVCSNTGGVRSLNPAPASDPGKPGFLFAGMGPPGFSIQSWMYFSRGWANKARHGASVGPRAVSMIAERMAMTFAGQIFPRIGNFSVRPTFFVPQVAIDAIANAGYSYSTIPASGKIRDIFTKGQEGYENLLIVMDNFIEMGTTYESQYRSELGYPYHQNFMCGYAMRSISEWWEFTGRTDNRAPYLIKQYMDAVHNSVLWLPAHGTIRWIANQPAAGTGPAWTVVQNDGVTGTLTSICNLPSGCTLTFTACPAVITAGDYVYLNRNTNVEAAVDISQVISSTCTVEGNAGNIAVPTTRVHAGPVPWQVTGGGYSRQGFGCAFGCWFDGESPTGTQLASMSLWANAWLWMYGGGDTYRAFYDAQLRAYVDMYSDPGFPRTIKALNENSISGFRGVYRRSLIDPPGGR